MTDNIDAAIDELLIINREFTALRNEIREDELGEFPLTAKCRKRMLIRMSLVEQNRDYLEKMIIADLLTLLS